MNAESIPAKQDDQDASRMTFTDHLAELRSRLVFTLIAICVAFIVCYIFSNELIAILSQPLTPLQSLTAGTLDPDSETVELGIQWTVLNPLEPVLVKLKLSAYAGILVAFPIILYQICAFVFPGLTERERRAVRIMIVGCTVLAGAGVAAAYWVIFPQVLPYLVQLAPEYIQIQLRLNETLSLVMKGLGAFGIAFQFPMIVLVLVYMELLTPATLKQYRRVAIVIMFVGAAMLTPPDPFSMLMMAGPLVLLYEASIWVSYLVIRRKKAANADN